MPIILNVESDNPTVSSNYGTLNYWDSGNGTLDFKIDLNNNLLGTDADVHKFGFNSTYDGLLTSSGGFDVLEDAKVPGLGSLRWDYVVDFGPGQPILDPAEFTLTAVDDTFSVNALFFAPAEDIKGWDGYFAVHAQNTITAAGSETVFCGVNYDQPAPVPEPTSIATMAAVGFVAVIQAVKRKAKKS